MTDLAIVKPEPINVAQLLQAIVKHGVTADAAGAVKELVMLKEHQEDRDAKQQWISAFAQVRGKMKTVNAVKGIPDKAGNVKWFYATLEDLQDAVEPILELHDLTMRFDSRREGGICVGICCISHIAGHEEKSECAVAVANAEGGDLGAMKKAKRGAMTAILGIKTRHMGSDAAMLGDTVSAEQASELKVRAEALGSELLARFITYMEKIAGTRDFYKVRQGKYGSLNDAISKMERIVRAESATMPAKAPGVPVEAPIDPIPPDGDPRTADEIAVEYAGGLSDHELSTLFDTIDIVSLGAAKKIAKVTGPMDGQTDQHRRRVAFYIRLAQLKK